MDTLTLELSPIEGLRALLVCDHTPLASIGFWLPVGSRDDPEGADGLAHLAEHLAFYGPIGDPAQHALWLEGKGAIVNAYTRADTTSFLVRTPIEAFFEVLQTMAGMIFTPPQFTQTQFEKELAVIAEERRGRRHGDLLLDTLHDRLHPYPRPQNNGPISAEMLMSFFANYNPSNAVVVIMHPYPKSIAKKVEELLTGPAATRRITSSSSPQYRPSRINLYTASREFGVGIGFRSAEMSRREMTALGILHRVLAMGLASRFHQTLVYQRGLSHHIYTQVKHYRGSSSYSLAAVSSREEVKEAFDAASNEYFEGVKLKVGKEELERARSRYISFIHMTQENRSQSLEWLGRRYLLWGYSDLFDCEVGRAKEISEEDLKALAITLFDAKQATRVVSFPKEKQCA